VNLRQLNEVARLDMVSAASTHTAMNDRVVQPEGLHVACRLSPSGASVGHAGGAIGPDMVWTARCAGLHRFCESVQARVHLQSLHRSVETAARHGQARASEISMQTPASRLQASARSMKR
jgi:hypothetical protein